MAGKKFAAEFALRRNVSAQDKILIQDSDDDVVKYAYPPQIASLSGYAYAQSVADLPLLPTNKSIGYIVGQMLYIYVGMGGDTKDGLYQSVGFFVGPQGVQGEKGEKGERGEQGVQGPKGDNGGLSLQELDEYLAKKQYVTGDTLADMLAGYVSNTSLMRDYVTIAKTQDVTGVKNFTAGVQFGGLPMYKSKDDTVYLDANLVVRGAVTMYGMNTTTSPSIFSALPIDGTTIGRNERGELYVIGGGGSGGGGVADSVAWSNVANKPTWITDTKPKYSYSEILDTPDLSVYAVKSSVDNALSGKADKATTLAGYGITNAYTKSEVNNIIDSLDDTYVTIAGEEQSITAEHNFVNGFKVGGLPIKKSQDKTLYLDANLVVSGAITMYGSDSTTFPTIWASIPFDSTMKWDGSKWSVVGSSGSGSGLDLVQLDEYLTTNGYATQDWVTGKGYITSSALEPYAPKTSIPTNTNQLTNGAGYITGITSSMVTNALGYTPYNSSNPAGYITSSGSITGNAATSNRLIEEVVTDLNNATVGRIFTMTSGYGSAAGNKPDTGWVTGLTLQYAQNGAYRRQLAFCYDSLYLRFENNTNWGVWRKILDDYNYSDYALPLSGGTVNGNVRINKFLAVGAASSSTNTARAQIHLVSSGANPCDLYFGADDTLYWSVTVRNASDAGGFNKAFALYDVANSAYRMMMFPNGNLAIGGTTASEKLHVYGNIKSTGDLDGGVYFLRSSNAANPLLRLAVGSQYYYVQAMSDAIYVGATSATSLKVTPTGDTTVRGNLLLNGAVTMYYSSDEQLKKNIRKVNASEVLMSLGGVWQYEYIDSEVQKNSVYDGTHFGLIYQNVKGKSLDKMCHKREDGYGTLNYLDTNFISLIAGATMENISEIEKLKKANRELKKKVEQLEKRLA